MNKKLICILIIGFFVVADFIPNISGNTNLNYTIYVNDDNIDGPWYGTKQYPYLYLWQAIENSTRDCSIYVYCGLYKENIVVDKQIKIIGEDKNKTLISGEYQDTVIKILSENVYIHGLTIKNSKGDNMMQE